MLSLWANGWKGKTADCFPMLQKLFEQRMVKAQNYGTVKLIAQSARNNFIASVKNNSGGGSCIAWSAAYLTGLHLLIPQLPLIVFEVGGFRVCEQMFG